MGDRTIEKIRARPAPPGRTAEALRAYESKRNFSLTPEPRGDAESGNAQLSFVIQKHWASSLHYDFRLELDGTLRSWAVPKGPSFDPTIKRMAMQVEDHPLSYAGFEGTIPLKQYGAGKVIVWDTGTWMPIGDAHQGLRDGNLKFQLQGHKIHGKWVLVRMKAGAEKQVPWLLIKEKDAFARPASEYSVVDELPDSVMKLSALIHTNTNTNTNTNSEPTAPADLLAGAKPATLPATLSPQLATLAASPPDEHSAAEWLYEIKYDGYRMLVRVDKGTTGNRDGGVKLLTRNGHDWTSKLKSLRDAFASMALPSGWYDGEIVVPDENGVPDFGALQRAFEAGTTADIVLYLFDLPYCDGRDLRALPLDARRAVLKQLLLKSPSPRVRFSEVFDAPPQSLLASACKLGLEGIIAKRRNSSYQSARSPDWIKLKCSLRQEFVICGFTEPKGERSGFGALLLGVHGADGALQYVGNVGTGFNQKSLASISQLLKEKTKAKSRTVSPFASGTKVEGQPHWVAPVLVAEVSFAEWTRSGHIRHAVFRGLRTDKDATAIERERAVTVKPSKGSSSSAKADSQALARRVHVTNPERVIDSASGITKIELVRYYALVGELMMKHLKSRPVSLVRAPTGVDGQLFFQKHAQTEKLPGLRQLDPAIDLGHAQMIEVARAQGLLSAAQWNVIEFHTMNFSTSSFEHPDRMVFDLDPGEGLPWVQVQEAAQLTHAFLSQLGLPSFLKTSGGKGLHIVVPLRKVHDWDTVRGFSQALVQHMAKTIPQRFVAKSGPKNRVGKIFIDYLRNALGATTVCAWSARARPGLGISVPVDWSELPMLRGGDHWTVRTVHDRLDTGNEPWKAYARAARSLDAAMAALNYSPTHGKAPRKET